MATATPTDMLVVPMAPPMAPPMVMVRASTVHFEIYD
jgi:hypothetical protein